MRELTAAIASGDTEAFARFYRAWFDAMFALARRCSGRDEQFCLDIVQEAMMRVTRSGTVLDSEAALHAWLKRIVQSCCCDALRREKRRARREQAIASSGVSHDRARGESSECERLQWLRHQLGELGPDEARLLHLRFRLGWTLKRIGTWMGLKPGAVDGRIGRSLYVLRLKAQEDFYE